MSSQTTNLNLTKMATTDTFSAWMTAFNGNMDIIDALGIPEMTGTGSSRCIQIGKMGVEFGHVSFSDKPCDMQDEDGWYYSASASATFPKAFVNTSNVPPVVIAKGHGLGAWPRVDFHVSGAPASSWFSGVFVCPYNDSGQSKALDFVAFGQVEE